MKNVLLLIESSETGGAEQLFAQLVHRLDGERYHPTAALLYPGWLQGHLQQLGHQPQLLPTGRGGFDLRLLRGLSGEVRRRRVDLIHAHLFTAGVYASLASIFSGVPVIATFHGTMDVAGNDRLRFVKWQILNRYARANVFVSGYLRDYFVEAGLAASGKARVIHNGIDCERFSLAPSRAEARRALHLDPDAFVVGCVGDLRPAKDYPTALRAAALLKKALPGFKLLIAGTPTALLADLQALRRALGLDGCVEFLGYCPAVEALLPAFDVYLSSSSSEGFSLTVAEAMAAGIPVVATCSGGPEELVEDGVNGLLVPVGAPQRIAEAIHWLSRHGEEGKTMAATGLRRVAARFSLGAMVEHYQELYEEVWRGQRMAAALHAGAAD